jgi:hypothetical protein
VKARNTLRDLKSGAACRPLDILRLAAFYLVRAGWTPDSAPRAGVTLRMGQTDRPLSIARAISRARADLHAAWTLGNAAGHVLNAAIGFPGEDPEPLKAWERAPGRSADDVIKLFRAAIEPLRNDNGAVLDVAV